MIFSFASTKNETNPPSDGLIEDFFQMGLQETVSPFLTPDSRAWGAHLTLKAASLAAVLLLLSFICSFFPAMMPLSHLLLVGVYFFAGIPSLIEAIEDLSNGEINIDILMTLAAFSSVFIGSGLEGGLLLVLFALSGAMEDAVTAKAKGAISSLSKLSPTRACIVESDGTLIERAIKDVSIGQTILVRAGQVVPLDGLVKAGTSSVNLVHLTGENMPVTKTVGDNVPAGGRNLEGVLTLEVERTSGDSTLAKIIELVTQAQEARPVLQRWFDKLSQAYAMTIIALSALFVAILPFILSIPVLGSEGSLYRALAFLIAASPCALIIAIPIAYLSAISICARKGVLLKGGTVLDSLAACRSVAFDKTGTLTTGELACTGVEALENEKQSKISEAVAVAYALERNAVHPIAQALVAYGMLQKVPTLEVNDFKAIAGYGLEGIVNFEGTQQQAYVGRPSYIAEKLPEALKQRLLDRVAQIEKAGELLAVLVVGGHPFIFRFRDTLRPHIVETVSAIKERGWQTIMLTGDHAQNANKIAEEVGVNKFYADLTPEDKLNHVSQMAQQGNLAMIGDGVNDAPALARATVGICMGKVGSTAAIDAADVVLLRDNIEMLDWLIGKAIQTQRIVKQNLALAILAIFVASLPALAGIVPLWLAVVMHEGGTVLVGLNALRLLKS